MTTLTPDGKQALDDLVAQVLAAKNIPGFVCGVSNLDEEIYFHGGGPNVVGDPSSGEVGPDSIMCICSQIKLITSLAALKLVEQGKISFDTPVADYLPQFRNPIIVDRTDTTDPQKTSFKPAETVVTLKHLLNFTSGLFYPDPSPIELDDNMPKGCSSEEMHLSQHPSFSEISLEIFLVYHSNLNLERTSSTAGVLKLPVSLWKRYQVKP